MKSLKKSKKNGFTLLEIMVCLAIISLLGAGLGIKGSALLTHHRFHSSLQTWLFDLQRMQFLAMNQGVDIVCKVSKNRQRGYSASFQSDFPDIKGDIHDLKEVSSFLVKGSPLDQWELHLFSSGRIFPSEVLRIEPRSAGETVWIDLSYPISFQTKVIQNAAFSNFPNYPLKEIEKRR